MHLVLARIDGAPAGVKGISLFIVPKVLVNARRLARRAQRRALRVHRAQARHPREPDLRAGVRRRRRARSATWSAKPNRGLEYMFIMMNAARLSVGRRGLCASRERAFQQARRVGAHARAGQAAGRGRPSGPRADHPSPRREAHAADDEVADAKRCARSRCTPPASSTSPTASGRERARSAPRRARDLLIPIVKGWCTETGIEVAVARRPGARRHGLHRGDRRRAVPARRAHHHDLRRHHRHPGERSARPQDRRATAARR